MIEQYPGHMVSSEYAKRKQATAYYRACPMRTIQDYFTCILRNIYIHIEEFLQ